MLKRAKWMMLTVLLVLGLAQAAHPALRTVGPVFPTDPADPLYNGFPLWYRDTTGVTLELPNPPAGDGVTAPTMIFDPVVQANPFSQQVGFGTEAFYYIASSRIDLPGGGGADLTLGLEAAFATGDAADGQQIVFSRYRVRIDVPSAGTYVVTYPYGQKTYVVDTPGTRAINDTIDVGVAPKVFTGALKGEIGPFLKAVTMAPGVSAAEWIGDGVTLTTVTGSPTGNNLFRIVGPDINGTGNNSIETDQFTVSGKIFTGTSFTVPRATYSRDAGGATTVDAWATTPAPVDRTIALSAQVAAELPATAMTRVGGRFYAHFPFTTPAFPTEVSITGTTGGANSSTLRRNLIDVVTVTTATYSSATKSLAVAATSSDVAGAPVLSANGAGLVSTPLVAGALAVTLPIPPPTVTVRSSQGGSQTVNVVIIP